MHPNTYQQLALRSQADQKMILFRLMLLGPSAMQLDNAARGLADECGELSGAVKKYIEYGQPLDQANLLEEVGDCLWRLAQLCDAAGFTLDQAMEANIAKLKKRYPAGYSDELAKEENRDRTNEALAMRPTLGKDPELTARMGTVLTVTPNHTSEAPSKSVVISEHPCQQCGKPAVVMVNDWDRKRDQHTTVFLCAAHDRKAEVVTTSKEGAE